MSSGDGAAMPVDDVETLKLELPDPETVYRNYFETCRRLGVEPVSSDRAREPDHRLVLASDRNDRPPSGIRS